MAPSSTRRIGRAGWRSFGWATIAGVAVTALVTVGTGLGWLGDLERYLTDKRMVVAQRHSPPISNAIVHVDIDDTSIREVGRWPWDREKLAMVIASLSDLGVKTIVLDLLLDDPQENRLRRDSYGEIEEIENDALMASAMREAGCVLIGVNVTPKRSGQHGSVADERGEHEARWPIRRFMEAAAGVGFVNPAQAKGSIQTVPAVREVAGRRVFQLGVAATAHHLGVAESEIVTDDRRLRIGDVEHRLTDGLAVVPWRLRTKRDGPILLPDGSLPDRKGAGGDGDEPDAGATPDAEGGRTGDAPDAASGEASDLFIRINQHFPIYNFVELAEARRELRRGIGTLTQGAPLDRDVTEKDLAGAEETARFLMSGSGGKTIDEVIGELEAEYDREADPEAKRRAAEDLYTMEIVRSLPSLRENFDNIRSRTADFRRRLDGAMVFIGWTGTGAAADFYPTALGIKTPGVAVHAAMANGLLTGHWVVRTPLWLDLLVTVLAGLSATLVATVLAPSRGWVAAMLLTGAYAWLNVMVLLDRSDTLLALAGPLVAAVGSWATCTTIRAIQERREKAAVRRQFRARVSAQLVDYLAEHPDLINMEGEERELTVAFTDFVGFTSISEQLQGKQTVAILNRYLRAMTDVMLDQSGYVNKFLGDGIMAFWGAPAVDTAHAGKACFAVLDCFNALEMLNEAPEYKELPKLGMRVGISTGKVIVGDCGAPPRLNDYTVIGDAVNLSARLESANKMLGTKVLVTQRTREMMTDEERARILWRPIGKLRVVGQQQLTEIFEMVGREDDPEISTEVRDWVERTREAVELFEGGEIEKSREIWEGLVMFERGSAGALLYLERCAELLESKREDYFLPLRSK